MKDMHGSRVCVVDVKTAVRSGVDSLRAAPKVVNGMPVGAAAPIAIGGFDDDDLRWLLHRGYVTWEGRCHLVLTDRGRILLRRLDGVDSQSTGNGRSTSAQPRLVPHPSYDHERHELRVDGICVRRFRRMAWNQIQVLAALESRGWPPRIDDPLGADPHLDAKHRLNDTVYQLNRGQQPHLILFSSDEGGGGICWRFATDRTG